MNPRDAGVWHVDLSGTESVSSENRRELCRWVSEWWFWQGVGVATLRAEDFVTVTCS